MQRRALSRIVAARSGGAGMISKTGWIVRTILKQLWFRATVISLLAVASALIALLVSPYLPEDLSAQIGAEAVDNILSIIASSMLAVTTFSLATMVQAYGAATSNVTPRATKLMIEDSTSQNVLATFVGSFLFSLVAIITLSMGAYGDRGRVVLFVVTILVVLLIVATLLRWIDYLRKLGRVGETTQQVENAAMRAMRDRCRRPYLGGSRLDPDLVPAGTTVAAPGIGYVQHIAMETLGACAEEAGMDVYVLALPGTFVETTRPLAVITGGDEDTVARVAAAFTIGAERSFDQDPRFGLSVLSEIASRALSPAVNDPGTAIDVLGRAVRVLSVWGEKRDDIEARIDGVYVPGVTADELLDDLFTPIARDGAGLVEVQIRLQKALAAIAALPVAGFPAAAARHSRLALKRARHAMSIEEDVAAVENAAKSVSRVPARERMP
jgi:uncharacterized membrane protein